MSKRSLECCLVLAALVVSAGAFPRATASGVNIVGTSVMATAIGASSNDAATGALKGRYKKEGDRCVWDANDSGPNQCEPRTKGRFKKEGDRCVWETADSGPDQCTPARGRFKKEGDRCVWTANDSGPNQCDPREPR